MAQLGAPLYGETCESQLIRLATSIIERVHLWRHALGRGGWLRLAGYPK